jgi:hypothetical protein
MIIFSIEIGLYRYVVLHGYKISPTLIIKLSIHVTVFYSYNVTMTNQPFGISTRKDVSTYAY